MKKSRHGSVYMLGQTKLVVITRSLPMAITLGADLAQVLDSAGWALFLGTALIPIQVGIETAWRSKRVDESDAETAPAE